MVDGEVERPAGALPHGYSRKDSVEPRPVWVRLAGGAYPPVVADPVSGGAGSEPDPDPAVGRASVGDHGRPPVPEGQHGRLEFAGEARGLLHHWERSVEGDWYGLVDFSVPLVNDFRPAVKMMCVLVHQSALRPRELAARDEPAHYAP